MILKLKDLLQLDAHSIVSSQRLLKILFEAASNTYTRSNRYASSTKLLLLLQASLG